MPVPPDFQTLVEQHGGYYKIPPDVLYAHHMRMIDVWVWLSQRNIPVRKSAKRGRK